MENITPMMRQYLEIKEKYKDCILFFRLGDFYEMFFEDAETASRELEITLTGRDCGLEQRAPMCGVPYHSADSYISRLINKGYKVAICEQVEDPALAKGIVKRDVVRVITPGTVTDSSMLDEKKNNYLLSVYRLGFLFGIAAVDITTGEFYATRITWGNTESKLIDEIARYSPSEIIANAEFSNDEELVGLLRRRVNTYLTAFDDSYYNGDFARQKIMQQFGETDIPGDEGDPALNAAGALIEYLEQTQKVNLKHIRKINNYKVEEFLILDAVARRNLELTETLRERKRKGSLLWVLDRTVTSMGGRCMRKWIEQPLKTPSDINDRLDAVSELRDKFMVRMEIRELLKRVYDIERLIGKIVLGSANCRDLVALKNSVGQLPYVKDVLNSCESKIIVQGLKSLDTLQDVYELIDAAIIDDPPVTVREGGIIKDGYNSEVDEYRRASTEGKSWIASIESKERERTGIRNLKVGYNKVFGYYIEVTKSNLDLVPQDYIRKQTLVNCERYITQELKEIENKILGAEEKVVELEYSLFIEIRDWLARQVGRIEETARFIAELDVLCSLAEVADRENYCRPVIREDGIIAITDGRHPVVEKMIGRENFVANDTLLDLDENMISIITGPNMAGKSTYMRQVALIVLMAQMGSFVPAARAEIGIVDRIFTRVGASDDLASGMSTFMVEMSEVAEILNNATPKSLLILDEIGRGTSTYDGLSIAWSVIEYISSSERLKCRTLFATHYHELTDLEGRLKGVKNYNIAVKEQGKDIIFLRKIVRGGADGSYGIQVARLAGLPEIVLERAMEILAELEAANISKKEGRRRRSRPPVEGQIDLFAYAAAQAAKDGIINALRNLDISNLTPIDALNELYKLQQMLKNI